MYNEKNRTHENVYIFILLEDILHLLVNNSILKPYRHYIGKKAKYL